MYIFWQVTENQTKMLILMKVRKGKTLFEGLLNRLPYKLTKVTHQSLVKQNIASYYIALCLFKFSLG